MYKILQEEFVHNSMTLSQKKAVEYQLPISLGVALLVILVFWVEIKRAFI